jgi:hypothetical protein
MHLPHINLHDRIAPMLAKARLDDIQRELHGNRWRSQLPKRKRRGVVRRLLRAIRGGGD